MKMIILFIFWQNAGGWRRLVRVISGAAWLLAAGACSGRLGTGIGALGKPVAGQITAARDAGEAVETDSLRLFDAARQRLVPVVTYAPRPGPGSPRRRRLALLSHGYGGHNTDYSFVARNLVAQGYFVASLQHELPGDAPLPLTGRPTVVRRPNWERGAQNMLFVLGELRRLHPALATRRVLLLGHSNGGDMAVLFAREHPGLVSELITFDNRRLALPRTRRPRVLSLRSCDQPADSAVVPTAAEQARFGIRIARLATTRHNDMWDGATPAQKQEMSALITHFLTHR